MMLSVIIPAHNEENYIMQTLAALQRQSFKDFETVVVCDGCTDNTFDKVKKHVEKVVVLKERKGPAAARNAGALLAKGEKFVFLDADTAPTEKVFEVIERQSSAVIGTCKLIPHPITFKHKLMMGLKNALLCPLGVTNGILFTSKENFQAVQGFGAVQKGEDGDFVRKLKKQGKAFVVLKEPVVTSMRRMEQKGYFGVWGYWLKYAFTRDDAPYEVIR